MSVDKNIALELGTISPVVAGIGQAAVYSVPERYFDGFARTVLARLEEETGIPMQAGEWSEKNGGVEIQPRVLGELSRHPVYPVPEGYFEGFAGQLMQRIKAEEARSAGEELEILSPLLSGLRGKEPFTTPEGYFSEMPGNLVAELQALRFVNKELERTKEFHGTEETDETETLSPLLSGLKNKETYTVSPGYFDTLASGILSSVSGREEAAMETNKGAKVISLNREKRTGKGWMKYAVAAALTGLLVTAGIRVFNRKDEVVVVQPGADSSNLAKVSDQEILNYLENQNEPLADVAANDDVQDINDGDVKDFLGDVPDTELQQYVDEHGSSKDPVTN